MIEQVCRTIIEENKFETLNKEEQERLITLFCHDLAVGSSASYSKWPIDIINNQPHLLSDEGKYTIIGRKQKSLSFDQAVQHNVMAITMSVSEDFIDGTHPGAIIFPVLLAETENHNRSIEELLNAGTIGLKLAIFLNDIFGKQIALKGFRPPYVIGAMAAAASLSFLKSGSSEEAMRAMALASASISGLAFPFMGGTEEWLLEPAVAAQIAVMASRNAKSISLSLNDFLTGPNSLGMFFEIDSRLTENNYSPDIKRIGVKKHPVNSFVQPAVEAVTKLGKIDINNIESISVQVPLNYSANKNIALKGSIEKPNLGLLSIPISCAQALLNGKLEYADFKNSNDHSVVILSQKFQINYVSTLENFDVQLKVNAENKEYFSETKTSEFYPELKTELNWIKNLNITEPWIETLENYWFINSKQLL